MLKAFTPQASVPQAFTPRSVTQLNTYVKSLLDGEPALNSVFVSGEISNFTNHYKSRHLYLSLKDERCAIKAVMFATHARRLRFEPRDGMKVIARGRVSLYEQTGQYQFYVEDMQPDGAGALSVAFEQLKNRLEKEGLFAQDAKKPLPRFPARVGVITSPTGAAVHDITTVLARRWPMAEIVFCPVLVQGEGAAAQLADALKRFNHAQAADVIIIGRGGGSIEDLWAFNEECVARAVAESHIPVISAVGHETDFSICDFAADLRAPTPSAAAELAVPDGVELFAWISSRKERLVRAQQSKLREYRGRLYLLVHSRAMQSPIEQTAIRRMRLDGLEARLRAAADKGIAKKKAEFAALCGKLHVLSPLAVLERGYTIAEREGGMVLTRAAQAKHGEALHFRFTDGILFCKVDKMENTGHTKGGSVNGKRTEL